jgi:hypothetical protein
MKIYRSIILFALISIAFVGSLFAQSANKRFLSVIKSRAEFDSIARVYHKGTPYALPHAMFVIDRQNKNKIYYVNSRAYRFHQDFVNANYLSLDRGEDFFKKNYVNDKRRFILGTLAWQTPIKKWTFEFWEGDTITPDLMKLAYDTINKTFFEPVALKLNSLLQEEYSAKIENINRVLQSDITKEQEYQALNVAKGIGRIHIINELDDTIEIGDNEILVLNEVPVSLPSVAGIIVSKPSTPLSHVNLLAKGWGVPNAYIKNAQELFKQYDGWWVVFETKLDSYEIKRADKDAVKEYQKQKDVFDKTMIPRSDLAVKKLAGLREQRKKDVVAYGAKSANLGELMNANLKGFAVPDGFTIPFYYYDKFMTENGFNDIVFELLNDDKFVHNPTFRRQKLLELQAMIQKGKFDDELRAEVLKLAHEKFQNKGLFARSSTNSEDLPNFNGAGLYSSRGNIKGDDDLIEGIKFVWASLWNYRAYEARERSHIPHDQVYMAVLIQQGINSEKSGVIITTDPYDHEDNNSIYISAKRGQGELVVSGVKVGEQVLYRTKSKTVKILTRSEEDSQLVFDEKGGMRQEPIVKGLLVLKDSETRRLADISLRIKKVFGNLDQDIEWAIVGAEIFIVQSRPYVSNRRGKYGTPLPEAVIEKIKNDTKVNNQK